MWAGSRDYWGDMWAGSRDYWVDMWAGSRDYWGDMWAGSRDYWVAGSTQQSTQGIYSVTAEYCTYWDEALCLL